jgi:hypothetical protein
MLLTPRMKKEQLLVSKRETTMPTRDGELSTQIIQPLRPRDLIRTSASTSTDHSTLSQDSQPTELLNTKVEAGLESDNGK